MKREKKGKLEYSKGITLIALVITIIVLLILAAVSVSTLTGENGILTKATKAKEDTQKEATREKVQMAVLASYNQNGDVDITILKKELEKIGGTVTDTNEEFPVTVDDYTFIIDEKGKVTEGSQGGSEIEEVYTLTEEYLDFDEETGSIALKEAYSYYDWHNGTFRNCELGKTKIKIPATYKGKEVKKIGIISGKGDWSTYQGFGIKDVEEIVLPDKVTAIEGAAFMGCTNLSRISLPDSIETIR